MWVTTALVIPSGFCARTTTGGASVSTSCLVGVSPPARRKPELKLARKYETGV
jgi:hypothetical protein